MSLSDLLHYTTELLRLHEHWAIPIVLLLSFSESLVLVAFLIPATVMLLTIGVLIGRGGLNFWPLWAAAAVGAILGDWFSYWLGYHYSQPIIHHWPLSKYPEIVSRSVAFFQRWGITGVFVGRFFAPLRASIPLAAGICRMPFYTFQLANIASGCLWSLVMLGAGAFCLPCLSKVGL